MRRRLSLSLRSVGLLGALLFTIAAFPACQLDVHCPNVVSQPWWGNIHSVGTSFTGYAGRTVTGTVFAPADITTYPGKRPVIVLNAGYAEPECNQWWSAWALAGHGYVTFIFSEPTPAYQVPDDELAVNWLASPANNFRLQTDMSRLGMVGHSAGSSAVQEVESNDTRVKAFVNFDGIRRLSFGCPDDPNQPNAYGAVQLHPRAPGLGVQSDTDCNTNIETGDPEQSTPGFDVHVLAGVPAGVLPITHVTHFDFETDGPDAVHQKVFLPTLAWLDRWVSGDPTALNRILSTDWNGTDRDSILSPYYRSAISVPTFACFDMRTTCSSPAAVAANAQPSTQMHPAPQAAPDPAKLAQPFPLAPDS